MPKFVGQDLRSLRNAICPDRTQLKLVEHDYHRCADVIRGEPNRRTAQVVAPMAAANLAAGDVQAGREWRRHAEGC